MTRIPFVVFAATFALPLVTAKPPAASGVFVVTVLDSELADVKPSTCSLQLESCGFLGASDTEKAIGDVQLKMLLWYPNERFSYDRVGQPFDHRGKPVLKRKVAPTNQKDDCVLFVRVHEMTTWELLVQVVRLERLSDKRRNTYAYLRF